MTTWLKVFKEYFYIFVWGMWWYNLKQYIWTNFLIIINIIRFDQICYCYKIVHASIHLLPLIWLSDWGDPRSIPSTAQQYPHLTATASNSWVKNGSGEHGLFGLNVPSLPRDQLSWRWELKTSSTEGSVPSRPSQTQTSSLLYSLSSGALELLLVWPIT